ncbi:MAG: site-2 protease family protein [Clostridia bacterium]|nr:site-2 protease family protein [Clostridia bacterium]
MVYRILFNSAYDALEKILLLLAFVITAMFAISLHEYAHGFAAYKMGDPTAKIQGRLTLNPISHFEPIGLIMFLLVGFGFARPVPINPYNFTKLRKGMLLTSFAGVIANLIQA